MKNRRTVITCKIIMILVFCSISSIAQTDKYSNCQVEYDSSLNMNVYLYPEIRASPSEDLLKTTQNIIDNFPDSLDVYMHLTYKIKFIVDTLGILWLQGFLNLLK